MSGPARDVLWAMVVLGIPASIISLAWNARDAVRWVRRSRAHDQPRSSSASGSEQPAPASPRTSTPRGGER